MFLRKVFLTLIISFFAIVTYANDSIINLLLHRIKQQQIGYDNYFYPGVFPSYREYVPNPNRYRKDENIYFSGLIAFTLRNIKNYLSPKQQAIADTIIADVQKIAPKYANRKGRNTYNYWPTDTLRIFPNSGWINMFDKKQAIADDLDDTAIMLLATGAPDSVVAKVHLLMQDFINKPQTKVRNTLNEYKKYGAYSIWFGVKMMVEYDVCVMSNILYMVQQYQLPWKAADTATLQLLCNMIENKHYLKYPGKISVYYKQPSIILYHIARLMSLGGIPALEKYKPQLIEDCLKLLQKPRSFMEKVILRTSLLQLGVNINDTDFLIDADLIATAENDPMVFFIANLACTQPKPIAFTLVNAGFTKYYYYCPAYNDLLLLEYLALKAKADRVQLNH